MWEKRASIIIGMAAAVASVAALATAVGAAPARTGRAAPTATIENLQTAIQGEANAAHRYDLFARRADEEGHQQVAKLFRAAALSERVHRRNHEAVLARLGATPRKVTYEPVKVGTTRENLLVPIKGERKEATEMYPRFIRQAKSDGVPAAVRSFTYARKTEAEHDRMFRRALDRIGHNGDVDYYVQAESGWVSVRSPSLYPPVTGPETAAAASSAAAAARAR